MGAAAAGTRRIDVLDNGLRVITEPMSSARSAAVSFYVGAGAQYEPDELAGVSHLLEHCLFKGSAMHPTAADLSIAIEGVGGYINAATDREMTVYYAKVPGPDWQTAVDVIVDMVCRPRLDPAELERERSVVLEELAQIEDSPYQLVGELMAELMWRGTPLGRDIAGTPESVNAISHEATVDYWSTQYSPANTLISVAGDVDADAVLSRVSELTRDWPAAAAGGRLEAGVNNDSQRVALRIKETEQTQITIALPGMTSNHPDRFVLSLLSAMLGDGMSSRLFLKVREELGLAYDVGSSLSMYRDTGVIQVAMGVDPDNVDLAIEATLGEVSRMRDGVPVEELNRAKRLAAGRMLMGMEDSRAVSAWNGGQTLLHNRLRSIDEVYEDYQAVSLEDIQRVATEYLVEAELRLAIVGPSGEADRLGELLRL